MILDGSKRQVESRDNNKSLVKQCSTRVMAKPHTAQLLYQPRNKRTKLFISSVRCTLLNSFHTHTKHCSMLPSCVQCSMFVIDTAYCSAMQCNCTVIQASNKQIKETAPGIPAHTLLHSAAEISGIMETEMPRSGQQLPTH